LQEAITEIEKRRMATFLKGTARIDRNKSTVKPLGGKYPALKNINEFVVGKRFGKKTRKSRKNKKKSQKPRKIRRRSRIY
jgi:hypothetical protein